MGTYGTQNRLAGVHMLERRSGKERRNNAPIKVPDEVVIEMRRLHEKDRRTHLQVHAAYPQYSKEYVRSILGYIIRAHLKPV